MSVIDYISSVSEQFMPHQMCYAYDPYVIWIHVISDLMIALAYYSIPLMIFYYARRRTDLDEFKNIFSLFGLFILLCGTIHLINIINLWYPSYWIDGILKFVTGIVSLYTAYSLFYLIPLALSIPDKQEYQRKLKEKAEAQVLAKLLHEQLEKSA